MEQFHLLQSSLRPVLDLNKAQLINSNAKDMANKRSSLINKARTLFLPLPFRPIGVITYSWCLMLAHALSLDFNAHTTLPTHLPVSTGCVFPNASSSNWQLWFTSCFMASHCNTLLMSGATLPTFQADDKYDQQALSSCRYPELGWSLSMTEPSDLELLDRGCGTVYHEMSLSVRLLLFFVKNSNISFLVCLPLDIDCWFVSLTWNLT